MRRGLITLSLLLATLAALPAGAAAVTFGANLARTPNNEARCFQIVATPQGTCSLNSTNFATGESAIPPAGEGIVSQVRVRVGPVTGPMQIAVEQALRQDNPFEPGKPNYACCRVVALSQVFTPAPNAVTTIPVNFPVKQSIVPDENGYYIDDHLSLSVLDPNVPIPANFDPANSAVFAGGWFPAWQAVGELRAGQAGVGSGLTILFNAEWNPAPGAAPGGTPAPIGPVGPPPPAVTGPVIRLPQAARVRNNRALLPLTCALDRVCRGLLRLQNRPLAAAADVSVGERQLLARRRAAKQGKRGKGKRKTITYASTPFEIPAGKKKTVRATLKAAGKRLVRRRGSAKVWANVTIKGSTASVPSSRVTLKRAPEKKKQRGKGRKRASR